MTGRNIRIPGMCTAEECATVHVTNGGSTTPWEPKHPRAKGENKSARDISLCQPQSIHTNSHTKKNRRWLDRTKKFEKPKLPKRRSAYDTTYRSVQPQKSVQLGARPSAASWSSPRLVRAGFFLLRRRSLRPRARRGASAAPRRRLRRACVQLRQSLERGSAGGHPLPGHAPRRPAGRAGGGWGAAVKSIW